MKKQLLTMGQMLAITATYPKNLCKKEADPAAVIKSINDGIEAIKTKQSTTEADLKELQKQKDTFLLKADFTPELEKSVKKIGEDWQKQFDELTLLVNKKPIHKAEDTKDMPYFLKENKTNLEGLQKKGGSFNFEMKLDNLFLSSHKYKHLSQKAAANITEGSNLTGSVNVIIPPMILGGIYANPLRPNHVRDVISKGTTDSSQIVFLQEGVVTDGTAATSEGGTAGQSDFALTEKTVTVRKLNTFLNISKEMIADASFVDAEINTRFVPRLLMTEDTQLWSGSNVSPNMDGLTTEAAPVELPAKSADDPFGYLDVLHSAVTQGITAYYKPDYIFMHPTDYNKMVLSKDSYGRYQFIDAVLNGAPLVINGATVVRNTVVPVGYFLVGDFEMGATLYTRSEIEVSFSTQNQDNFIKGFVTCLIEERLALVIKRSSAFIYGNFINAEQSGS